MTQERTGMDIRRVMEDYIVDSILFGDGEKLQEDVSLRASGVLDSLGFLGVITFMEQRFGIKISDSEVVPENFDTLRRMSEFVERKMGERIAIQ